VELSQVLKDIVGNLISYLYCIFVTLGIKSIIVFRIKYRKMELDKPVLKM
jgi:hypothetical protein